MSIEVILACVGTLLVAFTVLLKEVRDRFIMVLVAVSILSLVIPAMYRSEPSQVQTEGP